MPLRSIVGQEAAVRSIRGALNSGRINHALLFIGPGGVGKRTTALAFAQTVNCPQPVDGDACGDCPSCRRIGNGIDVDARYYTPARLEYRKEEAVGIRQEAYITPSSGRRKFLIMDKADRLNDESANLLLKIIEEPPEFTVFVLLAENINSILPTIRSRSLAVSFRPLSVDEVLKVAGDRVEPEQARYLYPVAKGDVGTILQLSEDKHLKELFDDIGAELNERLLKPVPASPMRLAEEVMALSGRLDVDAADEETKAAVKRRAIVNVLEIMMAMVEGRYMPSATREGAPRRASGEAWTDDYLTGCRLLESIMETIKSVEGGGMQQLAVEAMVVDIKRISYGRSGEKAS